MNSPKLIDYFEDDLFEDVDLLSFYRDKNDCEERRNLEKEPVSTKKPFRKRKRYAKKDHKRSVWYIDYAIDEHGTFRDESHRDGKLFRQRFCHSLQSVHDIAEKISEKEHRFWRVKKSPEDPKCSSVVLLVLGSLRILTRNVTLDDLYEATFISGEVHRIFFTKFMKWYSTVIFPLFIKMPSLEELAGNNTEYAAAGFPGAVCSVDCVHVRVWGVSANLKQVSTGKEHFPSRVFEVSVNHRGMITSATRGYYGSVTDQSIVKFDGAMTSMRDGCYQDFQYSVYDKDGERKTVSGAYALCDNGYHPWPCLMYPSKIAKGEADFNWSEMLESLRKDIECLFGQMKQEFAILKYGSRFNSLELMDDIFLTCCTIHNQRKMIAGMDAPWSMEILADDELDLSQRNVDVFRRMYERERIEVFDEENRNGMGPAEHVIVYDNAVAIPFQTSHAMLKDILITHFDVAHKKGEVVWPRRDGIVHNYYIASQR